MHVTARILSQCSSHSILPARSATQASFHQHPSLHVHLALANAFSYTHLLLKGINCVVCCLAPNSGTIRRLAMDVLPQAAKWVAGTSMPIAAKRPNSYGEAYPTHSRTAQVSRSDTITVLAV